MARSLLLPSRMKKKQPKRLVLASEKLVNLQADTLKAVAGARPCNMSHATNAPYSDLC